MLVELAVRDLGVIESARVVFDAGATALTGETGAGKTMLVEAIGLLCGARADPQRVRAGAAETVVEALFVRPASRCAPEQDGTQRDGTGADGTDETELVLRRIVPASGRSRAYVNGSLVAVSQLAEITDELLEIHGQHSQQGLLAAGAQRAVLDRFAGIDTTVLTERLRRVRALTRELEHVGGDAAGRERELALIRHELAEIDAVGLEPGEDERLEREEDLLDGAVEHRATAARVLAAINDDDGVADGLAELTADLASRAPFAELAARLESMVIELGEVGVELRSLAEGIEVDDDRLGAVRARRAALADLRRRYGGSEAAVLEHAQRASQRLEELEHGERRATEVEGELADARADLAAEAERVGVARRAAAPRLAGAVELQLQRLALPSARVVVDVTDDADVPLAGNRVELRIAANPGSEPGPLGRVASGGELSRVMLALRLVSSGGPPTMIFDEVDAGIGGETANAVAEALRQVADHHQVVLVTHLAQIAAIADTQVLVHKASDGERTTTELVPLDHEGRVEEVSRMLSGAPRSDAARRHAEELLASRHGRVG